MTNDTTLGLTLDNRLKVTFSFERKLNMGNYETCQASAFVSVDVPMGAELNEYAAALSQAAAAAKSAVYDELGIEVYLDDNGVIREANTPLTSVGKVEEVVNRTFAGTTNVSSGNGVKVANFNATDKTPIPQHILDKMIADGTTEVFDNRATATGKQPVFKETNNSAKANNRPPKGYWNN